MLQPSASRSVTITINQAALRHNLAIARRLGNGCKQFATVKADAYGHGAIAVMRALSDRKAPLEQQADGFAVVSVGEAIALREAGADRPILVLQGPAHADECAALKEHDLWPVIHDLAQYEWYRQRPESVCLQAWLKVDTGMGRLGVPVDQVSRLLNTKQIAPTGRQESVSKNQPRWMGVLSHLACADSPGNAHTSSQIQCFQNLDVPKGLQRSLANSAAILAWPASQYDWARPGLMLYGCNPLDTELPAGVTLKPVMSVRAPLISLKRMASGSSVGYAQTYRCPEDMNIGVVALGYGDGLPRVLDASATVSVGGRSCAIIGRVSMDSVAVDLRSAPDAQLGQSVEFWGLDQSVEVLANAAGTINYELLTQIRGQRHCSC